ncbi:cyclic nucleotide-binding domain-containing protein [bacterium]|nr:MAG: cyclic nucleotide-binding domain-containing protein [bacterium]
MSLDISAFKQNYLVTGLNDEQIAGIFALAKLRRLTAQEHLVRAGDPAGDLFVVLDGRVVVLTPDGDKLSEVGPGSVIGEIALIDAQPRTANVVAKGLVDVAALPANELRRHMNNDRNMGFIVLANLARVLCGRLRLTNEKVDELYDKASDSWDQAL